MYRRSTEAPGGEGTSDGRGTSDGAAERRGERDRRSGLDRRGGPVEKSVSVEPRQFGFRQFRERRASQDRRLYVFGEGPAARHGHIRHGWSAAAGGDLYVRLTREEIRILLASIDDERKGGGYS